jgi:hypothetical protein
MPRFLKFMITTPSGEVEEIIELKEGSTIEFYRSDLKRYQVPVDERLLSAEVGGKVVERHAGGGVEIKNG